MVLPREWQGIHLLEIARLLRQLQPIHERTLALPDDHFAIPCFQRKIMGKHGRSKVNHWGEGVEDGSGFFVCRVGKAGNEKGLLFLWLVSNRSEERRVGKECRS